MAEAMDSKGCSICQDVLKDPVTISCGHSYCSACIMGHSDQEDDKGIYSCPQCKQNVPLRVAESVEIPRTTLQREPPPYNIASTGNVDCDFCTGIKLKAVKSCVVCLVSFCETHLRPHKDIAQLRKHKLIQASKTLHEKICSQHEKLLEIFCHTDQQCICYLCTMDEHKGHDTISAAAERIEKQKKSEEQLQKSLKRIQEKEKEVLDLEQAMGSFTHSAQEAVEDSDRIFTVLIRSFKKMRIELKELIIAQERAELNRADGLMQQLKQQLSELKNRVVELNKLSQAEDHIQFLQSFQSLCVSPESEVLPSINVYSHIFFNDVKQSVFDLKEELQDLCIKEIEQISVEVNQVQIEQHSVLKTREEDVLDGSPQEHLHNGCPQPKSDQSETEKTKQQPQPQTRKDSLAMTPSDPPALPKNREDFLAYSCQLTLDPNTANPYLHLSEENKMVTGSNESQSYPEHPDRFTSFNQVLCKEGLSGVCYWEIEWSGEVVYVAVSHKMISRKGSGIGCLFGCNDQSWRLYCSTSSCYFYHNGERSDITAPRSSRVGVYLDYKAGILSFYSVSDKMTLLHTIQTTFTQALYPGFFVDTGSVKILTPIQ